MRVRYLKEVPVHVTLLFFSFIALVPIYYMFVTAFKAEMEWYSNPFGLPRQFSVEQIQTLVNRMGILRGFGNTLILTVMSCVIGISAAVLASYAFGRMRFWGQRPLFNGVIALLAMPGIVVLIPLYATLARLRLLNSYFGTSLVYAGFMMPFSIFVLTSFFRTVSQQILDAARIDGCGHFRILLLVLLPLSAPALITLTVVNSLGVWNDFLVALLTLQRNNMRTIVVELAMLKDRYGQNIPLTLAGSIFVGLPVMIAFILGRRYFVRGLASGAIK